MQIKYQNVYSLIIFSSSIFLVSCAGVDESKTTIQVLGSRGETMTFEYSKNLVVSDARGIAQSYCDRSGAKAIQNSELHPNDYPSRSNQTGEYWLPKGVQYQKYEPTNTHNLYWFNCVPQTASTIPNDDLVGKSIIQQPLGNQLALDDAKKKCVDLGFKFGTEQFGKCVLQLSK